MAGAAYQFDPSLTDDESLEFTFEWLMQDGADFPWAEYDIEYSLKGCGEALRYDLDSGLAVDEPNNLVTVKPSPSLRLGPGLYSHGMRVIARDDGDAIQIFDGTVTVTEGNF